LLRAAALLSPAELVFVLKENEVFRPMYAPPPSSIVLPCYPRVTSIELDVGLLSISLPPAGEFPALEKLSLAGNNILDLEPLLSR
jgi:hypothetical protein